LVLLDLLLVGQLVGWLMGLTFNREILLVKGNQKLPNWSIGSFSQLSRPFPFF